MKIFKKLISSKTISSQLISTNIYYTQKKEFVKYKFLWYNEIYGSESMNYTYMLKCRDDSLYTGWTNDLRKRLKAHNAGLGAKYTKPRRPVYLVYFEEWETKQEAMHREAEIKKLTRAKKLALIAALSAAQKRKIKQFGEE